jgi:hypothetical protein
MAWNHRVFKKVIPSQIIGETEIPSHEIYSIKETYYDDETGQVDGHTFDDITPTGETLEELKECLERMLEACNKEILEVKNL